MFNVTAVHFTGSGLVLARFATVLAILFIGAMAVVFRRLLLALKRSILSLPLSERVHIHTREVLVPISGRTHSRGNRHVR